MTTATIDFFLEIPLLSAFCLVSLFLPCNLSFNVFFPIGFSPSSWMNSRAASSFSPLYNILPSSVFLSLSLMITLKLLQNFAISFRSYLLTLSITRFLFFSPISFQCSKRWDTWQYIQLERKEFSPWQILILLSSTAVFILWQKKWTDGFDLFFFSFTGLVVFTDIPLPRKQDFCNQTAGQYSCLTMNQCYYSFQRCDGLRQCNDGTDESNCECRSHCKFYDGD